MDLSWMAWTPLTAVFFAVIALLLGGMVLWEILRPGGAPRLGILRFQTTRGDRLFISLLGSAFICLAFLGLSDLSLYWALATALLYTGIVFWLV